MAIIRRPKKSIFPKLKGLNVRVIDYGNLDDIVNYSLEHKLITKEAWQLFRWYAEYPDTWQDDPEKMAYLRRYKRMKNRKSWTGI